MQENVTTRYSRSDGNFSIVVRSSEMQCIGWRLPTLGAVDDQCLPPWRQDCEDESDGDGRRRERSLLLLASLASDALDAVSSMSKVRRCVIVLFWFWLLWLVFC